MASVIISDQTNVMLFSEPTFATYTAKDVADSTASTEVILVLGVERKDQVDELVDQALAAGAIAAGTPQQGSGRYQRGFTDLDGPPGRRCA